MALWYLSGALDQAPGSLLAAVDALPVGGLEVGHGPGHTPIGAGREGGPAELQQRRLQVGHIGEISEGRAVRGAAERPLRSRLLPGEGRAPRGHCGAPDLPDLVVRQKVRELLPPEELQEAVEPPRQKLLQSQPVPLVVQVLGPPGRVGVRPQR